MQKVIVIVILLSICLVSCGEKEKNLENKDNKDSIVTSDTAIPASSTDVSSSDIELTEDCFNLSKQEIVEKFGQPTGTEIEDGFARYHYGKNYIDFIGDKL